MVLFWGPIMFDSDTAACGPCDIMIILIKLIFPGAFDINRIWQGALISILYRSMNYWSGPPVLYCLVLIIFMKFTSFPGLAGMATWGLIPLCPDL